MDDMFRQLGMQPFGEDQMQLFQNIAEGLPENDREQLYNLDQSVLNKASVEQEIITLKQQIVQLQENAKTMQQMIEAMWDAPGMPGSKILQSQWEKL